MLGDTRESSSVLKVCIMNEHITDAFNSYYCSISPVLSIAHEWVVATIDWNNRLSWGSLCFSSVKSYSAMIDTKDAMLLNLSQYLKND